jgi:hypothetical protein
MLKVAIFREHSIQTIDLKRAMLDKADEWDLGLAGLIRSGVGACGLFVHRQNAGPAKV